MSPLVSTENSTTGRSKTRRPRQLSFARALQALESISPALAARLGTHVMFRTQRRSAAEWEQGLPGATRWTIRDARSTVAISRWGSGPLVLLVHGWNGRGSQLGAFVPPLVEAGYQVVTFDAPGHGASSGSQSSVVDFADAFELVADQVRPFFQPIHAVVAHSLGAPAVMLAMARWLERPAPAEGAGCEDPFGRARLVFIAPPIDMRDVTREFVSMMGLRAATGARIDELAERRLGRPLSDLYAPHAARNMRAPLLVLHDAGDRAVPLEAGRLLAEAWPGARFEVTSGLGHTRILRDPATVQRVVEFVRGTSQAPRVDGAIS